MVDPKLKVIAETTLEATKTGQYNFSKDKTISIKKEMDTSLENTILYKPEDFTEIFKKRDNLCKKFSNTIPKIKILNGDTLTLAQKLVEIRKHGKSTTVLNFASATRPGGGFIDGAIAQEEALCRASGLYSTLLKHPNYYDENNSLNSYFYTDNTIYSPDVPVIRDVQGYWLENPFTVSFITSPAPNAGRIIQKEPKSLKQIKTTLIDRIEKILSIAVIHNQRDLVLGAWGCGIFRNDPAVVASAFKRHILENPNFKGAFDAVIFAVYDPSEKKNNFNSFKQTFSGA